MLGVSDVILEAGCRDVQPVGNQGEVVSSAVRDTDVRLSGEGGIEVLLSGTQAVEAVAPVNDRVVADVPYPGSSGLCLHDQAVAERDESVFPLVKATAVEELTELYELADAAVDTGQADEAGKGR